ncbi:MULTISPECIES: LysR family transcriptional regulator [Xanthomonas]|uniref:LysR family transcriptional regulator n=1 Tax=Xanthomonas phaseoli pv. dieffenbachiae TaxID=92828 RepID=A0A1V9HGD2_9XANT|nr:LysR family transcriptional regulator [Xanthomonas phaseoli]MBO9769466.1 LysR family transcriptional regulator [Xanthomonas phaseoli pv. dieffenbachiae]MBO9777907.1 LysR family transcriptional regulator [Xanthomonas phaseoli pv. dieffenbachiae]MBO9778820.1 LysR family transcriptional regulator [Xanthomonas phaseoli pv. dieffenbachiae]MBO9787121.1 LysR family transcriptional regulator [Xanthomonas phaseoli pv. dieffenbachiae]MBO9796120.1 LysR family transcriptional regulator [Xanthomonas pha
MEAFVRVARAGGFRDAAKSAGVSASTYSDAIKRMEASLGVRLFNRTTRSVVLTDAGKALLARIAPALLELENAREVVSAFRDTPTGTLRLNVPVSAARLVLPRIVPAFMAAYPDITLEILTEESFVDVIAARCDAGIRYGERLQQDMVAIPIGPRVQRIATAAAPGYLDRRGRPTHPRQLVAHDCIRGRFPSGVVAEWEFERDGEVVTIVPQGQLLVEIGGGIELAIQAAIAGSGILHLFEQWLQPQFDTGALEPILRPWWQPFQGPYLYYPNRTLTPPALRAFIEFVKNLPD